MTDAADVLVAGDRIELRFPARGDLIVLARLVTSAISARAGFDIEELEDLRLAVGELCLLTLQGSDARRRSVPGAHRARRRHRCGLHPRAGRRRATLADPMVTRSPC